MTFRLAQDPERWLLATMAELYGPPPPPSWARLPYRLRRRVRVLPSGCWQWEGRRTAEGYGHVRRVMAGPAVLAHRLVYELLVGPVPAGFPELDHRCHRPADCSGGSSCPHRLCVRPDHLLPGTHAENTAAGRRSRPGR